MPNYTYKARDGAGKQVAGTMEAPSKTELIQKLHKMGYMTTKATEVLPGIRIGPLFESFQSINTEDRVMFNVQLSNLLSAGISLHASLVTLTKQTENKRLKETLSSVSRNVEAGDGFSEALSNHPKIFSKLFISMVKAGEASGKLDTILARFAVYSEQQAELKQKITGALFYPFILLCAGMGVSLFIVTFIIPQFVAIFLKAGIDLPLPTLILYKTGTVLKQGWYSILLFVIFIAMALQYYAGTSFGRLHVDQLKLISPLLGRLSRLAAISRFARTLGMLVASGVPILQSLEIVKEVIGNEVLARVIGNVHAAVEKGERISESLGVSEEFPLDAVQMISVGEETGKLDEMLDKISDFYDRWVDYTVKKLTTVLEPLLLVLMGALVGFIMASMLLPMFDMMKMLRHGRAAF